MTKRLRPFSSFSGGRGAGTIAACRLPPAGRALMGGRGDGRTDEARSHVGRPAGGAVAPERRGARAAFRGEPAGDRAGRGAAAFLWCQDRLDQSRLHDRRACGRVAGRTAQQALQGAARRRRGGRRARRNRGFGRRGGERHGEPSHVRPAHGPFGHQPLWPSDRAATCSASWTTWPKACPSRSWRSPTAITSTW